MATAVVDIDFEQIPEQLSGLHKYTKALVLVRLRGRPIGQATFTVTNGRISGTQLRDGLLNIGARPYWEQYLHDYLAWDPQRVSGFVPPTATVAVTTRDRPEDLTRCLQAIRRLPDDGQELLVIDNCPSNDAAKRIVESFPGIRYVREDRPGASAARNRALREAKREVVAFSDDDAAPDQGWLRALVRNFSDPLVLCVTGLTMPLELETEAQEWFERHCPFGRGFKRFVLEAHGRNPLHVAPAGTSANMALRRCLLDTVGLFDEALGPGTPSKTGEDFDMFSRILTSGHRIVYDPEALSWHRHRRTWKELQQVIHGYGTGVYAYLARSMFIERELSAPSIAWNWLRYNQVPQLIKAVLRRSDGKPTDLLIAELRGCLLGPWAYLSSRRKLMKRNRVL